MCGDSGIDTILITHPDRVSRQTKTDQHTELDLADAYVPFSPIPQDKNFDLMESEFVTSTLKISLIVGLLCMALMLCLYIAKGNAIQPIKVVNHAYQSK